ncbi:unnamed protein product [Gordionus sp. m RMFG-2023]|uniref:serine/threonine-protein kinase OSR1-like n=1 Tax=Gordionus sp. m RMFG-2023 TaxID=3053472 RepID=UPI0030E0382B
MTLEAKKNPWPNEPDAYELLDIIGYGATATVQAAFCKSRNEKCAIKRINLDKCNVTMDELLKEITVMSQCHHENVVSYFTSFVVKDELWLVIELLRGGSLLDEIKRIMRSQDCKNGVLEEVLIATIMKEVLKGIEYFHNNNQIHRDIKAGNILLGEDGAVQIADFGVSSWINTGGNLDRRNIRHTFVGTPCWMAPEVMEQVSGYNAKADIWSFGITAIELATGTAPYYKYPPMKVLMLTLSNDPPNLETAADDKDQYKNYSKVFRKMVADCLQKDPEKRPTATELLKHPFFKKAKDKKYIYQTLICDRHCSRPPPQVVVKKSTPSLTYGRLHRTETGEWEWSGEDDNNDTEQSKSMLTTPKSIPKAAQREIDDKQATISSSGSSRPFVQSDDREDYDSGEGLSEGGQETRKSNVAEARRGNESIRAQFFKTPSSPPTSSINSDGSSLPTNNSSDRGGCHVAFQEQQQLTLYLALRIRNSKKELNDIKFDFTPCSDTDEGVAQELLGAGLIEEADVETVAENLSKVTRTPYQEGASLVFSLNSAITESPDKKSLIGFAQLTLISVSSAGEREKIIPLERLNEVETDESNHHHHYRNRYLASNSIETRSESSGPDVKLENYAGDNRA